MYRLAEPPNSQKRKYQSKIVWTKEKGQRVLLTCTDSPVLRHLRCLRSFLLLPKELVLETGLLLVLLVGLFLLLLGPRSFGIGWWSPGRGY